MVVSNRLSLELRGFIAFGDLPEISVRDLRRLLPLPFRRLWQFWYFHHAHDVRAAKEPIKAHIELIRDFPKAVDVNCFRAGGSRIHNTVIILHQSLSRPPDGAPP